MPASREVTREHHDPSPAPAVSPSRALDSASSGPTQNGRCRRLPRSIHQHVMARLRLSPQLVDLHTARMTDRLFSLCLQCRSRRWRPCWAITPRCPATSQPTAQTTACRWSCGSRCPRASRSSRELPASHDFLKTRWREERCTRRGRPAWAGRVAVRL